MFLIRGHILNAEPYNSSSFLFGIHNGNGIAINCVPCIVRLSYISVSMFILSVCQRHACVISVICGCVFCSDYCNGTTQ